MTYPSGKQALQRLDLDLTSPSLVGLLGPNGAGKSTLMNVLGCLDIPTYGEYHLNGTDVTSLSDKQLAHIRNREIGFIFQGYNLIQELDALENVTLPLIYQGVSVWDREDIAMEALEKVDGCTGAHFHPPVMLLVAYDPEAAWKREDDGKNHGEIDAAIAVTQMMLQAADLGLGTTYVGMFDPEKLHAAFPELAGLTPIALLPMGYPAEGAHPSRLHTDRKPMEQLVKYL